uniref:Meckel syndrome type 1 protein n=1 Tax=Hydra vulgaris TaxID=6087 RepID=T2M4C4_HYDVU
MEKLPVGQYRTHDPPVNFAIKITYWKVTASNEIPSAIIPTKVGFDRNAFEMVERNKKEKEKKEIVIFWQEKLFSQEEFDYYSDALNCNTALEQKYHEDIETIKRLHGERPNKKVFTYTDSDSFTAFEEHISLTDGPEIQPNILTQHMEKVSAKNYSKSFVSNVRRRNIIVNKPTEVNRVNHVTNIPSKCMYIMLDLGRTDEVNGFFIKDERVLCKIKIDVNGFIMIKPDLDTGKVFTIETYKESREHYQYTIHHASNPINKLEQQQEDSLFDELFIRQSQLLARQVGDNFFPMPSSNNLFVYFLCEIVSACCFEYEKLYVKYLLDLPDGWRCDSQNCVGVTQSCKVNEEGIAHFCFPFDFQLLYTWDQDNPEEFVKWPTLFLQVFSVDSWQRHRIEGYGYCSVPDVAGTTCITIKMWRPKGDNLFAEMNRFFIGASPEIKDLSYVKDPGESDRLSKFYFKTLSTGNVVLKINSMFQTDVPEEMHMGGRKVASKWKKAFKTISAFASTSDSLAKVLDAFNQARKRMLLVRSTLPSI